MERNEIINDLNLIFEDIIDEGKMALSDSTTSKDIDSWDSLTNIQLVVAIEKKYKIKFTSEEITSWKNVGDMINCIIISIKN